MTSVSPHEHGPVVRPLPQAVPVASAGQTVTGQRWRITVLGDRLLRVEWSEDGGFEDRASTFAVRREFSEAHFDVEETPDKGVVVRTAGVTLRYDGRPFSRSGLSAEVSGLGGGRWRYGDMAGDLGGTARTLDEVDGRTGLEPGVVSSTGIAVLDDSDSFLFDDEGWVRTRPAGRRDVYVFAFGDDHAAAVDALYRLSGHPPVLPRWALGNWWSRFHPYSDTEHLALMDRFRDEGIPLSVAVLDMDWHRVHDVPEHLGTGWTGYTWDPALFPDPVEFLRALHDRGMRTTLNLHPADGIRAHEDAYPAVARRLGVDPGSERAIAFAPTDRAFLEAYFEEVHHPLQAQGVDFWWLDWQQGEHSDMDGVDPLWLLNHFHHLDATRDGGAGLTFSRYAGPGSHRYAIGFSGDTVISWASLAFQPEFTATAANIGYGWWSHDIGGHLDGIHDDELATRWVQLGVYSPILRLHSTRNPFIRKEPWRYPAEHRDAMTDALRLRHRLVPYLHTMNHRAAAGIPLVRPMYHPYPSAPEAYLVPTEFAFGSELLVAPIVEPADPVTRLGRARAWLPPGGWTDITTGVHYSGDRHLELHRGSESIPVLLRDGGLVPMAGPDDLDATRNPAALELLIAPASSGTFTLVEDAPNSPGADVCTTLMSWDLESCELRIGSATGATDAVPSSRTWTATFLGRWQDEATVEVVTAGTASSVVPVVHQDRWSVTVAAKTAAETIIRLPHAPLTPSDPLPRIHRILERAATANIDKVRAWRVVERERPASERIAELAALDLAPTLLAAITELLGA